MKVFHPNQALFFQELKKFSKKLEEYGFYLIGGTALALDMQHRKSIDFDFVTDQNFQTQALLNDINKVFPKVVISQFEINTLTFKWHNVDVSFFGGITFPLVSQLIPYKHIKVLSKRDIAAMKIRTIFARNTLKDYFDLAYLLEFGQLSLKQMIKDFYFKYGDFAKQFPEELILKTLAYTQDLEDTIIELVGHVDFWGSNNQQILTKITEIIDKNIKNYLDEKLKY